LVWQILIRNGQVQWSASAHSTAFISGIERSLEERLASRAIGAFHAVWRLLTATLPQP
jgi:hypothetical protein